jgi:hypothetical protein
MSTVLEAIKRRREEVKNRKSTDTRIFKPEKGITNIRFLPLPSGAKELENFMVAVGEHWLENSEGRKTKFYCPRVTFDANDKCPICEAGFELFATKDPDDKVLGKTFMPSNQNLTNIIVRSSDEDGEDVGPKIYKFGKKLREKIEDEMLDEEVDLSDPEEGMDFKVNKKLVQSGNQTFPNYDSSKINTKVGTTPIDEDDFEALQEEAADLYAEVKSELLGYKELKQAFLNLGNDEDDANDDGDDVEEAPKATKKKAKSKKVVEEDEDSGDVETEVLDEDAFLEGIKKATKK